MGLRYAARLRAAAFGMAAVSLMGTMACGEGGEEDSDEGGQMQEEGGEQEDEGE